MILTVLLYWSFYAAAIAFVLGCVARIVRYAKAPLHLRWELYPVPHEAPGRVKHGGSYFEETDWWTKPSRFGLVGDLKFMIPEMLFLRGLREFNPGLWRRSFPFHFGLYLLAGAIGFLLAGAVLSLAGPSPAVAALVTVIRFLYSVSGTVGLLLALLGALGLLVRRLTDESLRTYTAPADLFNLIFFLVTFALIAASCLLRPASAPDMLAIAGGALTYNAALEIPGVLAVGLFLAAFLVAYIPMTHMSHFIAKYFTYHAVRWDDAPNRRGGRIEARLAEYLTYRPTWSASHIGADGSRTWAQVAAQPPAPEVKK
jgi:nitrate reductase gamma subunit